MMARRPPTPKSPGRSSTQQARPSPQSKPLSSPSHPTVQQPTPPRQSSQIQPSGQLKHRISTQPSSLSNPQVKQSTPSSLTLASALCSSTQKRDSSSTESPSKSRAPAITRITPA